MQKRGLVSQKLSQVWIETVVYTLIGLAIIGTILAVVTPRIVNLNDQLVITQTLEAMNRLNEQVQDALLVAPSQREVSLNLRKGEYFVDAINDKFYYYLRNTGFRASEVNLSFKLGAITRLTTPRAGNKYDVSLMLDYSAYNLTYNGKDANKTFTIAPTPYSLLVINNGAPYAGAKVQLDIKSVGG